MVIVTGAGRAFCAGADVTYLTHLIESGNIDEAVQLVEAGRRVVTAVRAMPGPVIAAINGARPPAEARTSPSHATSAIASDRASIGQTFNRIGLAPDWGGSYHVPRLVGPARAAELFFFAEMVRADEAERIGLVNRVVPHDDLMPVAREWADRLAAKPALALRYAKEAVQRSLGATLDEMLDFETTAQRACFASADARAPFAGQAFSHPEPGEAGELQRRLFTGPSAFSFDLSVSKTTTLTETKTLELAFNIQNVLNHPTFFAGDQFIDSEQFGRVSLTATGPRRIEIKLRFQF